MCAAEIEDRAAEIVCWCAAEKRDSNRNRFDYEKLVLLEKVLHQKPRRARLLAGSVSDLKPVRTLWSDVQSTTQRFITGRLRAN